ncbi:MAG: tRNA (adenosine(37)-N6)-dimethylallyltransferase MiaA [Candidatus Theseobacter exili]|nr:tRNA (adenosine(37)-N6)-dimethylallyltransferase MiaA [Candidatus Theseobacter exili]
MLLKKRERIALVGPTGVGKTDVSVLLAEKTGSEIVSADSMQVYRGMDIGTSKPDDKLQKRVQHHLIDCVNPTDIYSVALYVDGAQKVINSIEEAGKRVLIVGGTGMYVRALLEGLFSGPGTDIKLREEMLEEIRENGPERLWERLRKVDSDCASKIGAGDTRRLIRALEVYSLTGQPISSQQTQWKEESSYHAHLIGLDRDRDDLYKRIENRVDEMIRDGLVDEVRGLISNEKTVNATAMQGIGYKEIVEYISGKMTLRESIDLLKRNTRRLAKRQLTWFRHMNGIKWICLKPDEKPEETVARIFKVL